MLARFLLLAAAATVGVAQASDLTGFDVEYDILTVTVSHEVEVLKRAVELVSPAFKQVETIYHDFVVATEEDVESGELTWDSHGERLESFLSKFDSYVPSSALTDKLLDETEIDFFVLTENNRDASWDVIYYGASEANGEVDDDDIASALKALDAEMKVDIKKAKKEELQKKVDALFEEADSISSDFKGLAYDKINALYEGVFNEMKLIQ